MNALYCIPRLKYQYIYISKENRDKILTSSPPPNPFHFKLIFYVLMLQKTGNLKCLVKSTRGKKFFSTRGL